MPLPEIARPGEGRLPVGAAFRVALSGSDDPRLRSGLSRLLRAWEERTGLVFERLPNAEFALAQDVSTAALVIECAAAGNAVPALGDDESYHLEVGPSGAHLRSRTVVGALRGYGTLRQLLAADETGWFIPALSISDRPRFPWRGLLIDVCRHWQPIEVIKRNLDGMALVKLNVLHLHLTDDEGFRIESRTHPELHERGSDGRYFKQSEIREIIAYAAERGIRVVPEFDLPGHCTSWLVSHPELGTGPGPYTVVRKFVTASPIIDPTNEQVYALLDDLLGEMAALFPDDYFHIGGDEANYAIWDESPRIQNFIKAHHLGDNFGLQAYFARRVDDILRKHGKRTMGWEEIIRGEPQKDVLAQGWSGPEGAGSGHLAAVRKGYRAIRSNGYYLDLVYPASKLYAVDPIPSDAGLTEDQQRLIVGGEATMWSEWVTPETIDSRIWPRTAAVAERLWSPREVTGVAEMYRRLATVSRRLEEAGLEHERNRPAMIWRLAGPRATPEDFETLSRFVELIEPVKEYNRGRQQDGFDQYRPLIGLADCARPESEIARSFVNEVEGLLNGEMNVAAMTRLTQQLEQWKLLGQTTADLLQRRAIAGRAGANLAKALADVSQIGIDALAALKIHQPKDATWRAASLATLTRIEPGEDAIAIPIIPAVRRLVLAAAP